MAAGVVLAPDPAHVAKIVGVVKEKGVTYMVELGESLKQEHVPVYLELCEEFWTASSRQAVAKASAWSDGMVMRWVAKEANGLVDLLNLYRALKQFPPIPAGYKWDPDPSSWRDSWVFNAASAPA